MCLATPSKILNINGKTATVKSCSHEHKIDLSLVKNVKIGDYVLVHGDMALNKVPKSDAKKILTMINELNK
ncbi:HypC/HybG/HupF family hydrogenase formation chaperone [Patescibacteria group bacterium]